MMKILNKGFLLASTIAMSSVGSTMAAHAQFFDIQSTTAIESTPNFPPTNVIDGDISFESRWTGNGTSAEIILDLETVERLDDIQIAWGRGNQVIYPFEVSARIGTSGDWTTIFTGQNRGTTDGFENYNLTDINARQVRISGLGDGDYNIAEVTISGSGGRASVPSTATAQPTPSLVSELPAISALASAPETTSAPTATPQPTPSLVSESPVTPAPISVPASVPTSAPDTTPTPALVEPIQPAVLEATTKTNQASSTESADDYPRTFENFNENNTVEEEQLAASTADMAVFMSDVPNRANASNLSGQTVDGNIYVSIGSDSTIDRVQYFIGNEFINTDNTAPFDLKGGSISSANPFNTTELTNGEYLLRAVIFSNDGDVDTTRAFFTIENEDIPENAFGLDPNLEPWENFDLDDWALDSPEGRSSNPCQSRRVDEDEWDEVPGTPTHDYIFTHTDGGMRFVSPVGGSTTSSSCNSGFPRSELREMLRRGNRSISTQGVNGNNWALGYQPEGSNHAGRNGELKATLRVNRVTTTGTSSLHPGRTIIGQIHADNDEPARLYYRKLPNADFGCIYLEHEIRDSDDVTFNMIGNERCSGNGPSNGIQLGELFSYEIRNLDEEIRVRVIRGDQDGEILSEVTVDMNALDSGYDRADEWMYFKAGAYTQNNTGDDDDTDVITFYRLSNTHDDN